MGGNIDWQRERLMAEYERRDLWQKGYEHGLSGSTWTSDCYKPVFSSGASFGAEERRKLEQAEAISRRVEEQQERFFRIQDALDKLRL